MNYIPKLIVILIMFFNSTIASTELKNITLQLSWFNQFQFAGYYIAKEKGFYKEVGLDVNIKPFKFGIDIPKEVSNNTIDFAIGREALILDRTKHRNIVALYALFQASPLVLLTTKESKINSINDFKNKRIMTTIANASEVSLKAMLKSKNINLEDLDFLKHTHNINDLITKKTDIISAYTSKSPFILKKQGIQYNMFAPKEYGFDMYSDLLFTSEHLISHDINTVKAFKKASLKGWEYAYSHIEESVELILKKYNTQNLPKEELIFEGKELKKLSYYETNTLGDIDLGKLQRIYDLYNVMGLVDTKVKIKDFVFIEDSFSLFIKEVLNNLSKYINLPYIYFFIILFFTLIFLIIYKQIKLLVKNDELLKNKKKLNEVFEASGEGIWDWNIQTNQVDHNHTWYKILGLDSTKDFKKDFITLIHPDDKESVLKKIDETIKGTSKNYQSEHRLLKNNGDIVWVIDKGRIVEWNKNDEPLRIAGSFSDITERKESEKKLAEQQVHLINSEKMASLGEMMGNIAHQWRQPLSVISTGASGLLVSKEFNTLTDEEIESSCNIINDNAQYLSKIINDFSDFIKVEKELVHFNLEDNINSFLDLVEGTINKNKITIIQEINDNIVIKSYPNALIQCFINIFNNSKDIFEHTKEDKYIFISSYIKNDSINISFKDNAGGIDDNILSKIFEPYFTTKHKSQGTGLGLNMTYRLIIDSMKGSIEAKNSTYKYNNTEYTGAEFVISLPID